MIWIGAFALVAAAVCWLMARRANNRTTALETVETSPVREVKALHQAAADAAGPGHFRQPCEITGAARPHKNGALHSELEKQECVWHRHRITRKYEERYRDSNGNSRRRTKTEVVSEHSSSTAFFVEDATGRMVVRPGTHRVDHAEQVLDTFEPYTGGNGGGTLRLGPVSLNLGGRSGTIGFQKQEWIVRPGTHLFVHGEAADPDSGRLALAAPQEGGVFLMSTRSQGDLVRSGNNTVLGFGIGAAAAGIAGAVLLVLGILN